MVTKMMNATWRITHSNGVVNGIAIVEILPLQPPAPPPLHISTVGPIAMVKPIAGTLGTSRMMFPLLLSVLKCMEGHGGGPNGAGEYLPLPAPFPAY
jgi:hypothetical protein